MTSRRNQITSFTMEEKGKIIRRLENGESNASVARELGVNHSTISMIFKNRNEIMKLLNLNVRRRKRMRKSRHEKIDNALIQWYKDMRNKGINVTGPMLQAKANEFGANFGILDFKCTTSWVNRFKYRHDILKKHVGKPSPVKNNKSSTTPTNLQRKSDDEMSMPSETSEEANSNEGSENYTSSWFAFKHMQFLMNKSKKKDKKRKAEDTEENEEEIPEQSNSNTASTIDEQIKVKFERMETTPPRHKESSTSQCQIYDTDFTDNASHDITNATSTEKDEELKAFTTFIYRKMKQYPEAIKNLVQQEICQVVFKADAMCQKTTTWEENNIIKDPEVNVSNESEDSITIKEEIYDIVND